MAAFTLTDANPRLGDRLAGWWSAWKYVVILLALLASSIGVNVWQWKRAITAPLRDEVAGLEHALEDSASLQASASDAARRAIDAANTVASRLEGAGADYRNAMSQRPLTQDNCAPGKARVDATNSALGAIPPEKQR